jgi:hypothetical protein
VLITFFVLFDFFLVPLYSQIKNTRAPSLRYDNYLTYANLILIDFIYVFLGYKKIWGRLESSFVRFRSARPDDLVKISLF